MAERERSVSIRFPPDLLESLKQLAGLDARSLNGEVVWVLRRFVAQRQEQQARRGRVRETATGLAEEGSLR